MNPWLQLTREPMPIFRPELIETPKVPRRDCAKKLLAHGPLTLPEFREITGWPTHAAAQALFHLGESGEVRKYRQPGTRRYIYELT